MNPFDRLHNYLVTVNSFIIKQRSSPVRVDFSTSVGMIWKGFYSESYVLYDFKNNDFRDYLSDFARFRTRFINSDYKIILRDKDVFQKLVASYIDVPKTLGILSKGRYVSAQGDELPWAEALPGLLSDYRKLIIKPLFGSGGYNIMRLESSGDGMVLNGREVSKPEFQHLTAKLRNYLVSELIQQDQYAAEIFPDSTNTIRMLTMLDPATGKPFIPIAVHRFGVAKTVPADNWTQGGLSASIDLEIGTLGKGVSYPGRKSVLEWHSRHPETQAQIEGVQIPRWVELRDKMLQVAGQLPFLKYIGWDLVATASGPMVIEGNSFSDINLLQVHKGLLSEPRVREFYKYYRVI